MPEYLSPGVYVEEIPSTIKPIAGVSTSTAAFVGIISDRINIPESNPDYDPTQPPSDTNRPWRTWAFPADEGDYTKKKEALAALTEKNVKPARPADTSPQGLKAYRAAQDAFATAARRQSAGSLAPIGQPVLCTTFADFTRSFGGFSTDGLLAEGTPAPAPGAPAPANGATSGPKQNQLAHGVYGFFNNGGTRCWVMRFRDMADLENPLALVPFEAIDEISLVVAPGITNKVIQANIVSHCENMSDRFAILDGAELPPPADPGAQHPALTDENIKNGIPRTDYGAVYFPWIKVFDIATKLTDRDGDGEIFVGPSGHMAGIYARTDHERGVHKAPANEVVRGALDLEYQISRPLQDGLNPGGINCIRNMNGAITVWGARTVGGDLNTDLKYINVRRLLLFLRKSIDHGTQWVVFEPNDRALWAKIVRNVTAFLTTVWRDGALFGSTPAEAFYVRCDDETNPPEERDLGRVITEIGVAIVKPAEFVIFRIEQWAGPQGQ